MKYTDIDGQRFSHGKHYYISRLNPIDITKRSKPFVKRVNVMRFYVELFKANVREGMR